MALIEDAPVTPLASAGRHFVAYNDDAPAGVTPWQRVPVDDVRALVDDALQPLADAIAAIMSPPAP